jgi:hypothetical protein
MTLLHPLTLGASNYLPSGPTPILFALLAQYHAAIPYTYRYRILTASLLPASLRRPTTSATTTANPDSTVEQDNATPTPLTLTSKTLTYLPALQLALSAPPGSLLSALVGYAVGYAYRSDALPGRAAAWRLPSWVVGGTKTPLAGGMAGAAGARGSGGVGAADAAAGSASGVEAGAEGFESLRRRLEGERAAEDAAAGGGQGGGGAAAAGQRTLGERFAEQFRGGGQGMS